jgi:hypothetical protein
VPVGLQGEAGVRKLNQRNIPGVGKVYQQFAGSALYFTAANMAMSGVILWQTTVSEWSTRNAPWLSFPVYLLLAVVGIFAVMQAHWLFVERSRNATASQQAYIKDNPAVGDLAQIKADLEKIKKRLRI